MNKVIFRKKDNSSTLEHVVKNSLISGYLWWQKKNSNYSLKYIALTRGQLYYFKDGSPNKTVEKVYDNSCIKVSLASMSKVEFQILYTVDNEKTTCYGVRCNSCEEREEWINKFRTVVQIVGEEDLLEVASGDGGGGGGVKSSTVMAPIQPFDPYGRKEIFRVYLNDHSSKTVEFDTRCKVGELVNALQKKFSNEPFYRNFALFHIQSNENETMLNPDMQLIEIFRTWPNKNDPSSNRLVFQSVNKLERLLAAGNDGGQSETITSLSASNPVPNSSSRFESTRRTLTSVLTSIRSKQIKVGNVSLSQLKSIVRSGFVRIRPNKQQFIVLDSLKLYFFNNNIPDSISTMWLPLKTSNLCECKEENILLIQFIVPGTVGQKKVVQLMFQSSDERAEWLSLLRPCTEGTFERPKNFVISIVNRFRRNKNVLELQPPESEQLVHPTISRPRPIRNRTLPRRGQQGSIGSPSSPREIKTDFESSEDQS